MYCNQTQNNCGIFGVKREVVTRTPDPIEQKGDENWAHDTDDYEPGVPEPAMVKPKRVKHRLPGVRLLRQIHALEERSD